VRRQTSLAIGVDLDGRKTGVGLRYEGSTPEEPHLHGGDFHCLLAAGALNHPHAHHISPTSTKCRLVIFN
jgi:hypothetical protein